MAVILKLNFVFLLYYLTNKSIYQNRKIGEIVSTLIFLNLMAIIEEKINLLLLVVFLIISFGFFPVKDAKDGFYGF